MVISPVQFACNVFTINGDPLQLPAHSMRHLYPIYNNPHSSILLKFGRQTHKSSTIGINIVSPCIKYRNYHVLYIAPTGNQVSVFSTDKLHSTIHGSSLIKEHYLNTKTKDQVYYKEFTNESKIYLRSVFHTADGARGISADTMAVDEIQDILSDNIHTVGQCLAHSSAKYHEMSKRIPNLPAHLFNHKIYAGTPKTIENTLERYWANSTQNEWIIKCLHCSKYNYLNEYNVGPECLICNKCSKPIFYENGDWVTMNPSGFIQGYRLPQIALNWINNRNDPKDWQINVIQTRKNYSTEKFYNEVLALPYANARNPLSPTDIAKMCKDYPIMDEPNYPTLERATLIVAGIDWGKGDTASGTSYSVLTIGAFLNGKFKVLYIKKYMGKMSDALIQIDDMIDKIRRYNVSFTIADYGDGRTSNAVMVKRLGAQRFAELYEHGSQKKKIKWDPTKGIYIMNRTQMMTDRFMEIKDDKIDFFRYEDFDPFRVDFLNIYSEYSEQTRMTRYDHIGADDCFHSYMFCRIASMIVNGELNRYLVGGDNEGESGEDDSREM